VVQGDGELATAGSVEDACDPMAFLKIPLSLCGLASQAYAVYKIEVRRGSRAWVVERRFSEFLALGETVRERAAGTISVITNSTKMGASSREDTKVGIPFDAVVPRKTLLPNLSEAFLLSRVEELSVFLDKLSLIASRGEGGVRNTPMSTFLLLETPEHGGGSVVKQDPNSNDGR